MKSFSPERRPRVAREQMQRGAVLLAVLSDPADTMMVSHLADAHEWIVICESTVEKANDVLNQREIPVVLFDREASDEDWRPAMWGFAHSACHPSILLASPVSDPYLFDEVIKHSGYDVIVKPLVETELRRVVNLAFAFWRSRHLRTASGSRPSEPRIGSTRARPLIFSFRIRLLR